VPIAVALDRCSDDPRPFIEGSGATHPSLIDTEHRLAELYHMTNVPTILWIDEQGRICRPHDSQYGTDTFVQFTKKRSAPYLDMIRAWVRTGEGALSPEEARNTLPPISEDSQRSRAERALAWQLHQQGKADAAATHFARAGEAAPLDWTIRRGSIPIQGGNPFGPEFFELAGQGKPEYALEAITPTDDPEA
jgi:hypothetical protein